MSTSSSGRSLPTMSVVVLCGGRSQRFGSAKGLAKFRGQVLIERSLCKLAGLSDDIFLSTNQPELYGYLGIPMVADLHPGCGPLGGLEAALPKARHDLLAVVACDMPFASPGLLRYLAGRSDGYDAVVPLRSRESKSDSRVVLRPEPLHAIYARSSLVHVARAIELDQLKPIVLIGKMNSLLVPPEEWCQVEPEETHCFANVNTMEELGRLERLR